MNANQLLELNFSEVRRRSLIVWHAIPDEQLSFKSDPEAMSLGEHIRHTWQAAGNYLAIARARRSVEGSYSDTPIQHVSTEVHLAEAPFQAMLSFIREQGEADLESIVDRSDIGYQRKLGDFLARAAYHEAVHTGQLLQAMRQAGIVRPDIWD